MKSMFQYDLLSRATTILYGSGLSRAASFDGIGQTTNRIDKTSVGAITQAMTFSYDGVGNRTVILDGNNRTTYTYDKKNRLIADDTTGTNAHNYVYSYDPIDNRLTSSETGILATWIYDASSRMTTSIEGSTVSSYTYDSNGNLLAAQVGAQWNTMTYDKENRLATYRDNLTGLTTYTYQPDGLKRSERNGSSITTLVWDGSDYLGSI